MRNDMRFEKHILDKKQKLIIYGAGGYGELALRACEQMGLKVYCFVDRNGGRKKEFLGLPMYDAGELENFQEDCILIASDDYFNDMYNYAVKCGCETICDISLLLEMEIDVNRLSDRAKEKLNTRRNYEAAICNIQGINIVHMSYSVSERCTLRCRDCSALMPYYSRPENIDLVAYKESFDRFLNVVDLIGELKIYGGEPFLNPEVYKLLEWYGDHEKIGIISIYTNGMIIPSEKCLEMIKKVPKTKIHISDYGDHNRKNAEKMIEILEKNSISYHYRSYESWQNMGGFNYRGYNEKNLCSIFDKCFAKKCNHFLKGVFYICPRQGHAVDLGLIPNEKKDYVDFNDKNCSDDELKARLEKLLKNKSYIDACKYCGGMYSHGNEIEPAIQTKTILRV